MAIRKMKSFLHTILGHVTNDPHLYIGPYVGYNVHSIVMLVWVKINMKIINLSCALIF